MHHRLFPDSMNFARRKAVAAFSATLFFLCQTSSSLAETGPRFPLDLSQLDRPPAEASAFKCPQKMRAATDMSDMFTFYAPDETQSVVDEERMKAYVQKIWLLKTVRENLGSMAGKLVVAPDQSLAIRNCIVAQTLSWAKVDGMLPGLEENDLTGHRQAILEMIWTSVTFANALALADQVKPLSPEERAVTSQWFSRLSDEIIAEFTPKERPKGFAWLDSKSNHRFWAGAAVGLMSAVQADPTGVEWSMGVLQDAVAQIRDDGGLPIELARGERALHYQNFAMEAIGVLLSLADANGVTLPGATEEKLATAVSFSLATHRDPSPIVKETGKEQELKGHFLVWAGPFAAHFEKRQAALADELRTVIAKLQSEYPEPGCTRVCRSYYSAYFDAG